MRRILILTNNDMGLYKFRKELIEELVKEYKVYISLPNGEFIPKLKDLGCEFIETPISRRGTNPLTDFKLFIKYRKIIKKIKPHVVLTYTIKPNIYGGFFCRIAHVPYISNITGLGTAMEAGGIMRIFVMLMLKISMKKARCVFFQNKKNQDFLLKSKIIKANNYLIPGSGVNLKNYNLMEYPKNNVINFLFISRIMKEKGIEEYLEAAKIIHESYPNTMFHIIGWIEEEKYKKILEYTQKSGYIKYYGIQNNIKEFIQNCHAIVLPSYHEGLSNVLLESASSGRPVIASRVTGCIETFDEGISGFGFEVKNVGSLVEAIIKFINLPLDKKIEMGINGRKKVEQEFNRDIVINAYLEEISKIIERVKV